MLGALLIAGVVEGISLTALLPLLNRVLDNTGAGIEREAREQEEGLGQTLIDGLAYLGVSPSVELLLVIIVVGAIAKGGLVLLAKKRVGYIVAHVATDLRLSMLRSMLASRWEYYLHQPIGQLTNSMSIEAVRAANAYLHGATMLSQAIQAAVYVIIATLVMWQAALFSFAMGLLIYLSMNRLIKMARKAGNKQTKFTKSMIGRLTDTLMSVKPLKSMGREGLVDNVLVSETKNINRALRREVVSAEVLSAGQEVLFALVLVIGIYITLVIWELPITTVMVLGYLLARTLKKSGQVQKSYQKMAVSESAYWSIQTTIRDAEAAKEAITGSLAPTLNEGIRLQDLGFSYGERQILDGLCLHMPAGAFTAIVGQSGSGKTTILDMVIGLLRPQSGQVLVDDIPLSDLDLRAWRRSIGYVPQETVLLHDTIYNNVTLGDQSLNEADAERALREAGAWDFVAGLEAGIQHVVGERGGKLSGGQRQRIMIARALAHRPMLLILDEATTALDPHSEAAICDTLRGLRGERTILAISHQPALFEAADIAYRLENGQATRAKGAL